ncbi:zinc finger Ran-binding domain-containing protein 2-like [Paramacrobiotus metropolitanus]|uniref:zinc finger Ran-binding domain-containing protein 2-like n=1 Tax=Paramacrobiotus metropolitanus TaxID=2943436 RepID=UPI002445DD74|nr:zinc finger Ran-binding domain-containing protein 2-like [Paramacrobiotus metropolitanus]
MATRGRPRSFEDWECPECANLNFSKRTECNRCRKPKPDEKSKMKKTGIEIGKQAAEKSKGLFSADDWMCTKCGNVNWARRKNCNTCNAPKFQELEERTGFGGGFNEREGIEYNEREESDGEYDDFGRKKKKNKRGSDDGEPGVSSNHSKEGIREKSAEAEGRESEEDRKSDAEEEEEEGDDDKKVAAKYGLGDDDEEEEDEDDGDTDKYKLFDDDEEPNKSKPAEVSRNRDRDESDDGHEDKKVLSTDKRQARKRYPGSRSSSSSSRSSGSSHSSSSSSSSSRSSRSRSPSPRGSKRKSRESR